MQLYECKEKKLRARFCVYNPYNFKLLKIVKINNCIDQMNGFQKSLINVGNLSENRIYQNLRFYTTFFKKFN